MFEANWGVLRIIRKHDSGSPSTVPPANDGKRYYRGEFPRNRPFENRILSPEPEFVRKKRHSSDDTPTYDAVSTTKYEILEKSGKQFTLEKRCRKNATVSFPDFE